VVLPYKPPYDWDAMARFLAARATASVENVDAAGYHRTILVKGFIGSLSVAPMTGADALVVDVEIADRALVPMITDRVAAMFDVDADPAAVQRVLSGDAVLKNALKRHPGIRVPGAWDPFELSVRAILGQQVTVRAATTISGRIAARWGSGLDDGTGRRVFPGPSVLADAPLEECGIIRTRAGSIRALARAILDARLSFDSAGAIGALTEIRGIGDWTAHYIAMRTGIDKDAFPAGDLVLRRRFRSCTARQLERRSQKWRPFRSYAAMLLWTAN
jgi:AraC family transcriptional regulator of adaptative response / DNA-3-methyladenine glycosylase II